MSLWKDLVYAIRRLTARRGFLFVALATLTLGVGVNATIFTFVNGFLLKPLPVAEPSRLSAVVFGAERGNGLSYPDYRDIRDRNEVFSSVATMRVMPMALSFANGSGSGRSDRAWGFLVSGNYFETLGITPARGRFIEPQDDGASPSPVVVLGYAYWQSRFAGDPQIVGRAVKINGEQFNVIGVAPEGFLGTEHFLASDVWVPFSTIRIIEGRDWRDGRGNRNAWAIARLKPGVTNAQAEASLKVLAAQMIRENPAGNEDFAIHLQPPGLVNGQLRGAALGMGAALLLVGALTLLVACTNLSGLVLAHAADRRKEMAIRLAIGAGRGTIVRMLLTESMLIGIAGWICGLIVAAWSSSAIQVWAPMSGLPLPKYSADWRVFAFGIGAALLTTILAGLLPALRAGAVDVAPALKNESTAAVRGLHLRDVYLGVQVAVCIVLLAGSVAAIRSLQNTLATRFGFDPDHAAMVRVDLEMLQYNREQCLAFDRALIERVRAIPGVDEAGISNSVPFSIDQSNSGFSAEGIVYSESKPRPSASVYESGPGYFRAMGTRMTAGRDFDERDRAGAPLVAIVNQTLVSKYMPPGDPIGRRIRFGRNGDWMQIAGVVEAGKYESVGEDPRPAIWTPREQEFNTATTVIARSRHRPEADVLADLRRVVAELNPELPVFEAQPLSAVLGFPTAPLKLMTGALTVMGGLAAVLCALGLFGLLAYSVVQRTREIGIRRALGAGSSNVVGLLLKRTLLLVGSSAIVGFGLSVAALRLLGQVLNAKGDATVYGPVVMLLAAITVLAGIVPARRVLRIHPSSALRHE
jgi:predicted permease